jgi:hypothetical protein
MRFIKQILSIIRKFFFDSREYAIYHLNSVQNESYVLDSSIKVYSDYNEIPGFVRKKLLLYPLVNSMYHRIKQHQATLHCIYSDNQLVSYGWIQSWKPFKRKFGWLFKDSIMLGPYWTESQNRGQGYYVRLLKYSIAASGEKSHMVIYTSPENQSSIRGIVKAGFNLKGVYRINFAFRFFQWHKKIR